MKKRLKYILVELARHLPYSVFGISLGLVFMGILTFLSILIGSQDKVPQASEELFHVFHPIHIFFSAVATTAMFQKHEKRLLKAIVTGLAGSVGICSLSDIFFPFVGGTLLGMPIRLHICLIETPGLILTFAVTGILAGLVANQSFEHSFEYSHSAHVFLSSMASILYLTGFGMIDWIHSLGQVFIITIVAVMIPCCTSDIVFPLACVHRRCEHD
jgi:hypothetical protein